MRRFAVALLALAGPPAFAEIQTSAPDALVTSYQAEIAIPKATFWSRLVKPSLWWASDHTYSGSAENLSLSLKVGGCWCETWAAGAVEHGRVVAVVTNQLLRLDAALGPLQELGVKAALSVTIKDGATPDRIVVRMEYRAIGSSATKLDVLAGPVDHVLAEQFARLTAAR